MAFTRDLAIGFLAGYSGIRLYDAVKDLRMEGTRLSAEPVRYGRARRRFALSSLARSIATFAAVEALSAPFVALARSGRPLVDAAIAWSTLGAAQALAELPIAYVEDFVTERSYGMSEQLDTAWFGEYAKARAIELPIGTALFALALAGVRRFPRTWPLVGGGALIPLLVLANVIAPVAIAPLFNEFTPLDGPVADRLRTLAERHGVGGAALLRVDMSKQTTKANAYVTGVFGAHRIVVADTLLDNFADDEIEFVVAHELGHYVKNDAWLSIALGTIAGTACLITAGLGRPSPRDARELLRITTRVMIISLFLGPFIAVVSRRIEQRADDFAIATTNDREAGVRALERLRERNLAEDEAPWWWEVLFASHPSLRRRIARLGAVPEAR